MLSRIALRCNRQGVLVRFYSEGVGQNQGSSSSSTPKSTGGANTDVPGLSDNCVHPSTNPVGPGVEPNKSGAYKVPEYFCYDNMSFFEAEIEMARYRLPQPSALKK